MPTVLRFSAVEVGGVIVNPEFMANPTPANLVAMGNLILRGHNPTVVRPTSPKIHCPWRAAITRHAT